MDSFFHSESFHFGSVSIARLVLEFGNITTCYQRVIKHGPNLCLGLERSILVLERHLKKKKKVFGDDLSICHSDFHVK